ncbi:OmpH family outer membrane protein [Eudoraea chungangensis]|uniref:OmpH family outer membrane protein n=1 Tax=Eudoraea chungangensis TaxID=1481905 RepID=UPI0023EB46C8|nr:OmpH family outer membrane protein [Eudoraea chungangensis]
MKNLLLVVFVFGIFSCEQTKMGYVDNVRLMNEYQEKIDIETKYQSKTEALAKKRDSISQAFQIEAQAFQVKSKGLSQEKAQEEYGVLQQKGQFIGQQLQQEEQQLQQQGQTEMDSLISKVRKQVKNYGKTNGYSYILTGGDGGSVLYGSDGDNVTDDILKILNANYQSN